MPRALLATISLFAVLVTALPVAAQADTTAPTVTVVSPMPGEPILAPDIELVMSAVDDATVAGAFFAVQRADNGFYLGPDLRTFQAGFHRFPAVPAGDDLYRTVVSLPPSREYRAVAIVLDPSGNRARQTWSFRTTPPPPPPREVAVVSPSAGETITTDMTDLVMSVTDPDVVSLAFFIIQNVHSGKFMSRDG